VVRRHRRRPPPRRPRRRVRGPLRETARLTSPRPAIAARATGPGAHVLASGERPGPVTAHK
jgi:hypothetical protein